MIFISILNWGSKNTELRKMLQLCWKNSEFRV